ncbi:MAG: GntR family transcriptional regulator [Spirochaetales bacterium]|nr:GntR family transcriptional regulator [Spirochaetales bacterium]
MDKIIKEPVYLQICKVLKSLIEQGEFGRGDRFLSEREVSQRFEVSRTTANKALSSLVGEGILVYKKGVGTFVSEGSSAISVDIQDFLKSSTNLSSEIKVFCERAYEDIPDAIQSVFDKEKSIYYIMTVYTVGAQPVLISRKYINSAEDISSGEDFIEKSYYDFKLVKKDISLSRLKRNDAPLMKKEEGEPLYLIRDELIHEGSVIYDVSLMRSDIVSFSMDLEGILNINLLSDK